jgi:cytochrome-b5 reductase
MVDIDGVINGGYCILCPDQRGYFDLLIKSYEHGKMSSYLHSLKAGSTVEVRGPVGRFKYQPGQYSCIGLIAGGTGLTPCLQVVRCVLLETNAAVRELDKTKFVLFFQNRMEEDILLRDELDELSRLHSDRLSIVYFLSNATSETFGKATNEVRGYIGAASIQSAMSPAACPFVCICGPSGFNDSMKAHLLAAGHTESGDSPSLYIW